MSFLYMHLRSMQEGRPMRSGNELVSCRVRSFYREWEEASSHLCLALQPLPSQDSEDSPRRLCKSL